MTERKDLEPNMGIDEIGIDNSDMPIEYFNEMERNQKIPNQEEYDVADFNPSFDQEVELNDFDEIPYSKEEIERNEREQELRKETERQNEQNKRNESISNSRKQLDSDLKKLEEAIERKTEEIRNFEPATENMTKEEVVELNNQKQKAIDELTKIANEWSNVSDKVKNIDLEVEKSEKLGKDVKNPIKEFIEKTKEKLHNAMNKLTEFVDDIKFNLETRGRVSDLFSYKNEEVKQSFHQDVSKDAKIFEEEFINDHNFSDPETNKLLDEYVNVVNKYEKHNKILDGLTAEKDKRITDIYENHPNNKTVQKAKEKFEHDVAHASDVSRFEQAKMGAFIIHDAIKGRGDNRVIEYNLKTDDPDRISKNIDKSMNKYNRTIAMNNKLIEPKVKLVQAWAAKTSIVSGAKAYRAEQKMAKIQKSVQEKYGDKGLEDFNKMANNIRHNDRLADKGARVAEYAKTIGVKDLSRFMKSYNEYAETKQPTAKMQEKYKKIEAKANELGLHLKKTDAVVRRENESKSFTKESKAYDIRKDTPVSKENMSKASKAAKATIGRINDVGELIKDAKSNANKNKNEKQGNKDTKSKESKKQHKEDQEFSL